MNNKKIRIACAIVLGILIGSFGVFIFSDFQYRGKSLTGFIFDFFRHKEFQSIAEGFYELLGSGLKANVFSLFSGENLATQSWINVLFGETLFPVILTWLTVGILIGSIMKGIKYSYIINGIIFGTILILFFISGIFSGANIASMFSAEFGANMGSIATAMGLLSVGALFGGIIGGPNYFS